MTHFLVPWAWKVRVVSQARWGNQIFHVEGPGGEASQWRRDPVAERIGHRPPILQRWRQLFSKKCLSWRLKLFNLFSQKCWKIVCYRSNKEMEGGFHWSASGGCCHARAVGHWLFGQSRKVWQMKLHHEELVSNSIQPVEIQILPGSSLQLSWSKLG